MQQEEKTQIAVLITKVENLQADVSDIKITLKQGYVTKEKFEGLNYRVAVMEKQNNEIKKNVVGLILGLVGTILATGISLFIFKNN